MNTHAPIVITYIAYSSEYDEDCILESKKLSELSDEDKVSLFSHFLNSEFKGKENVLRAAKLFNINEVKEQAGIKIANNDEIYAGEGYSPLRKICLAKELSLSKSDFVRGTKFYVEVDPPENIKNKIKSFEELQKAAKEKAEQQKLARKIKKAEKLLKEAGKL